MPSPRIVLPAVLFLAAGLLPAADAQLDAMMERGQWKRIRTLAEARLRSQPGDAAALVLMSQVKSIFGDPHGAYDLARKAVAANPRDPDAQCRLGETAGSLAGRESMFKAIGYAKEIKEAGETALALNPRHLDAMELLMIYYQEAPALAGGSMKKAKELAWRIAGLDQPRGLLRLAAIADREKDPAGAMTFLQKALAADPRHVTTLLSLGNRCLEPKEARPWEAAKYGQQAIAADPLRIGGYSLLAVAQVEQGQWKELDATLAQAEKAVPENLAAHYAVARSLVVSGKDLPRAERYLRKYLGQEPEGMTPSLAAAHWRLGLACEKMNRKAEAIAEMTSALKLEPDFEAAKKDLKRLK